MTETRPSYYKTKDLEAIDVMEALDPEGAIAFCRFSALKYLWRVGGKDSEVLDYEKASFYCRRAAEIRERFGRGET